MRKNFRKKTNARLIAVQALYQIEQTNLDPVQVIKEFIYYRLPSSKEREQIDYTFFSILVEKTSNNLLEIDDLISKLLIKEWSLLRLDLVLKAILRLGIYELKSELNTDIGIVINDYVNITKKFFNGREPAFINKALDKGSKVLRISSVS